MNKHVSMTVAASALVALAGSAMGATKVDSPMFNHLNGVTPNPAPAGTTVQVDISGIRSIAGPGSGLNDTIFVPLPANAIVTGVGWSTNQTSFGLSWISEMNMLMSGATSTQDISVSFNYAYTTPGTSVTTSSGGVIKFGAVPLPDINAPGGLTLEFFESYDDDDPFNGFGANTDGIYNSGSTVTIQYVIPTPATAGLLGLAGVAALGRKRRS